MIGMELSKEYTAADHETRDSDAYAISKYRITLRWLKRHWSSDGLLLHVGCGGGFFHTMMPSVRTIACEPDPRAREMAERTNPRPRSIQVQPYSLLDIQKHVDERAHTLVMHDVLEHIEDEAAAVRALSELVTPEGRVVVSVPALQSLFGHHDTQLGHYRRYNKRSLQNALSTHFDVLRIRYFGFAFIPIVLWFSVLRRRDYPKSETQTGVAAKVLGAICRLEEWVAFPLGTSLICELRKKT